MKQNVLALSAMAIVMIVSTAASEANAASQSKSTRTPPDQVYYDTGCRNVISHHVTRSGEVVTDHSRTCY